MASRWRGYSSHGETSEPAVAVSTATTSWEFATPIMMARRARGAPVADPVCMTCVLVTGGAGFLGSHLCEQLQLEECRVICLDNFDTGRLDNVAHLLGDGLEVIRHDVVDPFHLEVDEIFHLACPSSPAHYQRDPVRTLMTAFMGTLNVLDLARDTGARVVLASTSEVYGDPEVHPQPEMYWGNVNPIGDRACHDEGKRAAETLATSYLQRYDVDVRIARIFNTYGPRMDRDDGRVVSNFIVQALLDRPLTVYGDGHQTRSFCFVSDLIRGLRRLMAVGDNPGPTNLGNPEELTVAELAELVLELTGSCSPVVHLPLPSDDPTRRRPDIDKARMCLDWRPTVSTREGVARTAHYFRARLARASEAYVVNVG
jgi:UDP-glucuronate decarboxylase